MRQDRREAVGTETYKERDAAENRTVTRAYGNQYCDRYQNGRPYHQDVENFGNEQEKRGDSDDALLHTFRPEFQYEKSETADAAIMCRHYMLQPVLCSIIVEQIESFIVICGHGWNLQNSRVQRGQNCLVRARRPTRC